ASSVSSRIRVRLYALSLGRWVNWTAPARTALEVIGARYLATVQTANACAVSLFFPLPHTIAASAPPISHDSSLHPPRRNRLAPAFGGRHARAGTALHGSPGTPASLSRAA